MNDGQDFPRTMSTAIPAIAMPSETGVAPTQTDEDARARIATLDREAKGLGASPAAALLFHEIGLLWEHPLKHPRFAAVAYQAAYKLAPRFLANIRAARRLFAEVGNWQMVVTLLDAELNATENKRGKAALLFEKGVVLEQRLSREADAITAWSNCLALEPEDITLLCQLEQLYSEKSDHASLVKAQKLIARVVTDDAARAHYLTSAGLLLEDRVKDLNAAAACFREAFALDRQDSLLLAAMKRVAQREGTVDEELAALAAEAEGQGVHAAPTFLQISKAYERLSRPEDALAALVAARRIAPQDPLVLSELARIYESQGRFEELADVLLSWVGAIRDESELIAINLRLGSLFEDQLRRDPDAIARYQAILDKIPGHATALANLGKLFHRSKNWAGLLGTYDAEAASMDDPKQKAIRVFKSAEVLEERLQRTDEAIARYNEVLKLLPGYLPAQKALVRLFEKQGKWVDLVGMYEQDLLQTTDREQQIQTLNRMSAIHEDRLTDIPRAIDCCKRVLEIAGDHLPTVRNLQRLYERGGQWEDLILLNEQEATLSGDTRHIVSLAHRNAEILEDQLKDRTRAVEAYERVLAHSPTYPPALKALGRLYAQDGKWAELIRMYRAEAEIAPTAEQAAHLTFKIGELHEQRLKNENDAIASFQEVLTLAPNYFPAVRALGRIYRSQGAWESLIEILRAEAANRSDPMERANAMFQAAAIWDDQLKSPAKAIEGYNEVLRLAPNHLTALQQLERLLTASDDTKELIVLLDRQTQVGSPQIKISANLKLARIYLDRLNEPSRAAACCDIALQLDERNLAALKLLERIRAGDRTRRNELRARLAEIMGDPKLSAAMKLAAVEQGQRTELPAVVVQQLKAAHVADPRDEALHLMLERALVKAADHRSLVELYEARSAQTQEPTDGAQLKLRAADLYENRLNDGARAAQAYEAALELVPNLLPAQTGLARVFGRMGNFERARAALEAMIASARDKATVTEALLQAGRLARDQAKDPQGAAAYFQRILDTEPLHAEAGTALEDLLASRGGAADLAALHERRGDTRLAQRDNAAAGQEFYAAARVHLDQLKDKSRAAELLEKALMALPAHNEALELKGDLALEKQDYVEAAAAFAVRVQQGGDAKRLASIHLKLGALYHDQLGDGTRAAAHLQTALMTEPESLEALERLGSIHTLSKNWTGAADCLRRLIAIERAPAQRAKFTLQLARIYDEGFADNAQAAALYKHALELAPGDSATLDRLVELYEKIGNLQDLVVVLEEQVKSAPDVRRAVALRLRIGDLYARQLQDAQKGIATYRAVLELDPANLPAHVALADLFGRDPAATAMAVESHRALLRLDPTRVDSLHALFRLWEGVKQLDKAFCAVGVLAFLKQANDPELGFYTELKNRLPAEPTVRLADADLALLHHPAARNPLSDVLRAVGDQFTKVYPPQFESWGVDRKNDRLKNDHAVFKAVRGVAQVFGVEEFEVYQSKRGLVVLETTEPMGVFVGADVVRRFNAREQRFLLGRAALGLYGKTAALRRLSSGELNDLFGNTVRIHQQQFEGIGKRNEDQSKQLRKAYSRRSLKLLEEPAMAVAQTPGLDVAATVEALALSADRAGLLLAGDVTAAIGILLREDLPIGTPRPESAEAIAAAVGQRRDVRELIGFSLSDDFFRLRQRLGMSLG
ncbi:MAG: Tetratricopeptide repeat protein [Myxococcaceae bacterium]|nr:Tetratricopeptide repeat protein [Myxococcaceae bacterium]